MAARKLNIVVGMKFGRLTVLREVDPRITHYPSQKTPGKKRRIEAVCECGIVKVYDLSDLSRGHTVSCGCHSIELATARAIKMATHGMRGSREYTSWVQMRERCLNPKHTFWKDYGGRGIKVCERWDRFENFYADMGPRPAGQSLDRWPNKDGNYEPSNCRWTTQEEQCNNRRNNIVIDHDGFSLTIAQWSRKLNIPADKIYSRRRHGKSVAEILTP